MKKLIISLILPLMFFYANKNAYSQGCESSKSEEGTTLFGFIQPQYDYVFTDPVESTFKFKRARIGVTGNIPYDFSYYLVMENSAFVSSTGYPALLDAFITYNRYKWAKVSFGSFKQPFGQEVSTSCSGLYTIDRALVSDQIVAPQRDMGLMILGGDDNSKFKYNIAIMNGRGLGIKDNNKKKDYIGRATYKPFEFLRLGGSFRYGFPNKDTNSRISYAGEMEIKIKEFKLQVEYIFDKGDYNRAASGGCGSTPLVLGDKREGAYAIASYMTKFNVEPVFKYEYFDIDKAVQKNNLFIMTAGINYYFNDWTRVQLNYQYKAEKGAEIPDDAIMIQLQVKF